jgi:hypothetical protein
MRLGRIVTSDKSDQICWWIWYKADERYGKATVRPNPTRRPTPACRPAARARRCCCTAAAHRARGRCSRRWWRKGWRQGSG